MRILRTGVEHKFSYCWWLTGDRAVGPTAIRCLYTTHNVYVSATMPIRPGMAIVTSFISETKKLCPSDGRIQIPVNAATTCIADHLASRHAMHYLSKEEKAALTATSRRLMSMISADWDVAICTGRFGWSRRNCDLSITTRVGRAEIF